MQRFFFDLRTDHDIIRDHEGVEAIDLKQATAEAQTVIDEMRRSEDQLAPGGKWRLAIRDENGATLKTLPLT